MLLSFYLEARNLLLNVLSSSVNGLLVTPSRLLHTRAPILVRNFTFLCVCVYKILSLFFFFISPFYPFLRDSFFILLRQATRRAILVCHLNPRPSLCLSLSLSLEISSFDSFVSLSACKSAPVIAIPRSESFGIWYTLSISGTTWQSAHTLILREIDFVTGACSVFFTSTGESQE